MWRIQIENVVNLNIQNEEQNVSYRWFIQKLLIWHTARHKGELIKAGHYVLLRRTPLLSQPENERVCSLGDNVAFRSETNDWFMCVISEINDPSKEVKVRFMRRSGQYFLLSKRWKSGSQSQQYFTDAPYHPLTIACVILLMPSILKVYVIK